MQENDNNNNNDMGTGDKIKAAAKAVVSKVKDPEKDIESEYQKEKTLVYSHDDNDASPSPSSPSSAASITHDAIPQYKKLLVPHDGSELSDKALAHAIYLSKISNAEIVIVNVVEHLDNIDPSLISASTTNAASSEGNRTEERTGASNAYANKDLNITIEGKVKQMIESRMRVCIEAGVKSQVSYKIQTGEPVDEIVKLAEEANADLIIMASTRVSSSLKTLGSTARKVIDKAKAAVLIVHK
jgi:nucleotide-binding universal stress UspA family protein